MYTNKSNKKINADIDTPRAIFQVRLSEKLDKVPGDVNSSSEKGGMVQKAPLIFKSV